MIVVNIQDFHINFKYLCIPSQTGTCMFCKDKQLKTVNWSHERNVFVTMLVYAAKRITVFSPDFISIQTWWRNRFDMCFCRLSLFQCDNPFVLKCFQVFILMRFLRIPAKAYQCE